MNTIRKIKEKYPGANITALKIDLSSFKSIRNFVKSIGNQRKIDILINNAGVFEYSLRQTEDGFESDFGVNYLGIY